MIDCINKSNPGWFIYRLDSDPRLHDLKLLVLELLSLYSSYLWRTDSIVISKLNKSPSQISPPSLLRPPSNWLEINKPPGGLNLLNQFRILGNCPPTPPQSQH